MIADLAMERGASIARRAADLFTHGPRASMARGALRTNT
jgi:hypothetical protein